MPSNLSALDPLAMRRSGLFDPFAVRERPPNGNSASF
jgi:hypothetical protein